MGKTSVSLKLKDLYAIKHALEFRVEERQGHINLIEGNRNLLVDAEGTIEKIKKDIDHEERLIDKFVKEIEAFESVIVGNKLKRIKKKVRLRK